MVFNTFLLETNFLKSFQTLLFFSLSELLERADFLALMESLCVLQSYHVYQSLVRETLPIPQKYISSVYSSNAFLCQTCSQDVIIILNLIKIQITALEFKFKQNKTIDKSDSNEKRLIYLQLYPHPHCSLLSSKLTEMWWVPSYVPTHLPLTFVWTWVSFCCSVLQLSSLFSSGGCGCIAMATASTGSLSKTWQCARWMLNSCWEQCSLLGPCDESNE